jgi:hypothetical protein
MSAATGELVPPKRIPVHGRPIRLRWLQQIVWSFLAANVGALIIAALYYLIIQVRWQIGGRTVLYLKPDWDHLFSFHGWPTDRHDVRNVYEALLATLFVKSLLANWRKRKWRAPAWYVLLSPMLIVVVAFPIVVAGIWLINYALPYLRHAWFAHHAALHNPVHLPHPLAWLGTYLTGYPWQPLIIGVLDPYQHLPHWPWPPVIRERAAWIMDSGQPVPDRTRNITAAVWIFMAVLAGLAIYGGYVRYWVAKGH